MNKKILYIGIALLLGLFLGWLLFGITKTETTVDSHNHEKATAEQMWTCSMHPQIMLPEAGDCPICGMDLIPAETGATGLAVNEIKMTENAMALANIQTTVVGTNPSQEDDGFISLSGKIATNDENNAVQASYFDGRLERLNVSYEGQKVNRGQLLATIYSPSLVAAQQELITTASLKSSQPALYQAVRNKLKLLKLSDQQINAIETSGKVQDNFSVYATVSGTVSEVLAAAGDYVKQGQPILRVSNLNSVWAEFDAFENQISEIKKGQKINIITNAYPNREFEATISFIDPILNTQTRTVNVRATLNNKEDIFKPGMFVTGKLKSTSKSNTAEILTIPASAVLWTGARSLVYIKSNPKEPVFEMREVQLGSRVGNYYQITSGITTGDEIVTNGTFTVDAAAQLQGKNSMMNKGKTVGEVDEMGTMEMELSLDFQKDLQKSLVPYLKLKDAFITSEADLVSVSAKAASNNFKSISTSNLGKMELAHFQKVITMLDAIANNDLIDNQREHFVILNENLVALFLNMKIISKTTYVQKCPMANNNRGAVWLSTEQDIRNPYFGDAMLTCGSTINVIQ